jgi:hypothetical protein
LREKHKLRGFKNMVLMRILGPKRDELTGRWRELHIEELHDLYSSRSIVRMIKLKKIRWAGHVVQMGQENNTYGVLV